MKRIFIIVLVAISLLIPFHATAEKKKSARKPSTISSGCSACSIAFKSEIVSLYRQDILDLLDQKMKLPEDAWEAIMAKEAITKCKEPELVDVLWGAISYSIFIEHFRDKISCARTEYAVTKAKNSISAVAGMGGGEACLQRIKELKIQDGLNLPPSERRKAEAMVICWNNCLIPMGIDLYRTHRSTRSCRSN